MSQVVAACENIERFVENLVAISKDKTLAHAQIKQAAVKMQLVEIKRWNAAVQEFLSRFDFNNLADYERDLCVSVLKEYQSRRFELLKELSDEKNSKKSKPSSQHSEELSSEAEDSSS